MTEQPELLDLRRMLRRAWRECKVGPGMKGGRPGTIIRDLVKYSTTQNKKIRPKVLENWLTIYDEFLAWKLSLYLALRISLNDDAKDDDPHNNKCHEKRRVFCAIVGHMTSMMFSIRHLVEAGLDVSAKQVLRSFNEYAELVTLLILKEELVYEFSETYTREKSNEFWYKNISKGKARKVIDKELNYYLKKEDLDKEIVEWKHRERGILSMSSHPSILASQMSIDVPFSDGESIGFCGAKSLVSVRTLAWAINCLTDFLIIGRHFPFGNEQENENNMAVIEFNPEEWYHLHVKNGRDVLMTLILINIDYQDHPDLAVPKDLEAYV